MKIEVLVRENSMGEASKGGMGGMSELDRTVVSHGHGGQARGDRPPADEFRVVAPEATKSIQSPRSLQDATVGPGARDPKLAIVVDKIVTT